MPIRLDDTPFSLNEKVPLAHAEPQMVVPEGILSAHKSRGRQSTVSELTAANPNVYKSCPTTRNTTSMSKSVTGSAKENILPMDKADQMLSENPLTSRQRKMRSAFDVSTSRKSAESSGTGLPKMVGKNQPRIPREYRVREPWQVQKNALKSKFGSSGWSPRKRLSPDALEGIRALNSQYPEKYTTPVLADQFQISPEAVRRILKSKWRASEEEESERRQRWDKRGAAIWSSMVEIGIKPPKKWRDMGIGRGRNRPKAEWGGESRASVWNSGNSSAAGQESGLGTTLSDRIL